MMAGAAPAARRPVALIPLGAAADACAQVLAHDLRKAGYTVEIGYSGNIKRRLNRANKADAAVAVIIGDEELAKDVAKVRDMDSGEQFEEPVSALVESLALYR